MNAGANPVAGMLKMLVANGMASLPCFASLLLAVGCRQPESTAPQPIPGQYQLVLPASSASMQHPAKEAALRYFTEARLDIRAVDDEAKYCALLFPPFANPEPFDTALMPPSRNVCVYKAAASSAASSNQRHGMMARLVISTS